VFEALIDAPQASRDQIADRLGIVGYRGGAQSSKGIGAGADRRRGSRKFVA